MHAIITVKLPINKGLVVLIEINSCVVKNCFFSFDSLAILLHLPRQFIA